MANQQRWIPWVLGEEGYNAHKAAGGSFATYSNKEYLALDDNAISDHLNGNKTIGFYPLLSDK